MRGNRTGKGYFVKGRSGNPTGRPKNPPVLPEYAPDPAAADRRIIPSMVVEARKYSALAIDTLVESTKDNYPGSTRYNAATALLDRGYGRPAQSLDLHLSADAIMKRFSDMSDAELAALEARMIAAAPIVPRQLRTCRTMQRGQGVGEKAVATIPLTDCRWPKSPARMLAPADGASRSTAARRQ